MKNPDIIDAIRPIIKAFEKLGNDILGVIKVQRELLDKEYLSHWAREVGVSEILEKAFMEAS